MMTEAPFETADRRNDELTGPSADVLEGGSANVTPRHKTSGFRNFFKHSPSNNDGVTPRSEGAGASGRSGRTHQATMSGDEDFDDHMRGSPFQRTDICKACGFPRGSSVGCPVTRRHHGTDEDMTPGQHNRHHNRTSSGAKNIMARIREKLPLTPSRKSNQHANDDGGDDHTPQTGELQHLSLGPTPTAAAGAERDGNKHTPLIHNHTLSPQSLQNGEVNENAQLDAYASGDSPAEEVEDDEVQYFCYTDENGDTYYYTQELQETVRDTTPAPQQPSHAEGESEAAAAAATTEEGAGNLPSGSYIYQYVDENGETVNCLCTPQGDGEAPAAESRAEAEGDAREPNTSAVGHAGSDTVNSSETEDTGSSKKKSFTFFSTIQNVFKSHRNSHPRGQHEDPQHMGASSTSATTPADGNLDGTTSGAGGDNNEHDAAVIAFTNQLDADEKKKFMKERKRLVKELAESEKKEREIVVKARRDGMAAFGRDRLAGAFAIRKDERTIKTGAKRGEPL